MAETDHLSPNETTRTEVDDVTLARVLRCDEVTVRKYAKAGIIQRGKGRKFPLFQSIGQVVEYLRQVAGRQGTADAMKAGAALKDAQRRLTEMKLAKLDGTLMSLSEAEALWGDLAAGAKWLFLAVPKRARDELSLNDEQEERLSMLCVAMLREVALAGQMQLPSAVEKESDADIDDDEDAAESEPSPSRQN